MTLVLFAAAAVAAGLGSAFVAAGVLVAAAVAGATGSVLVAATTWTAALGAGLLWLTGSSRRLALPIAAAAAALAAGASENAAAVLALWVASTVALLLATEARRTQAGRRWGVLLCATDAPVAFAVIAGSAHGFAGWPSANGTLVFGALVLAAAAKVVLASGPAPEREAASLLVIRTQIVIALLVAVEAAPHAGLEALVLLAVAAFAVVPLAGKDTLSDVCAEASLVAIAAASGSLGWGPRGWVWGALAAGTLVHHLRVSSRRTSLRTATALVVRGGVIGLPLVPVVVAELEAVVSAPAWLTAAVVCGLVFGLYARIRSVQRTRLRRSPQWTELLPLVFVVCAVALALWAPLAAFRRPPAGVAIAWTPPWGLVVIVVAAAAGAAYPSFVRGPGRVAARRELTLPAVPGAAYLANAYVLEVLAGALVVASGVLWIVGAIRGFL